MANPPCLSSIQTYESPFCFWLCHFLTVYNCRLLKRTINTHAHNGLLLCFMCQTYFTLLTLTGLACLYGHLLLFLYYRGIRKIFVNDCCVDRILFCNQKEKKNLFLKISVYVWTKPKTFNWVWFSLTWEDKNHCDELCRPFFKKKQCLIDYFNSLTKYYFSQACFLYLFLFSYLPLFFLHVIDVFVCELVSSLTVKVGTGGEEMSWRWCRMFVKEKKKKRKTLLQFYIVWIATGLQKIFDKYSFSSII